jgi:hypothetical protein
MFYGLLLSAVFLIGGVAECITAMKIATPLVAGLQQALSHWVRWLYGATTIAKWDIPRISSCRMQRIGALKNTAPPSRRFATELLKPNNPRYLHAPFATGFLSQ